MGENGEVRGGARGGLARAHPGLHATRVRAGDCVGAPRPRRDLLSSIRIDLIDHVNIQNRYRLYLY